MVEEKRRKGCLKYAHLVRKLFITSCWVIFPVLVSLGQMHWRKVDSSFGELPAGMHVYFSSDSLDGSPFLAYYASVKLKEKQLAFSVQTSGGVAYTPSQFFLQQEHAPWLIVNGPFFDFENNHLLSLLIRNGRIIAQNVRALKGSQEDSFLYYYPTRSAIGIDKKRRADVAWVFSDSLRHRPYAFQIAPVIARGRDSLPTILDLGVVNWAWWEMRTAIGGGPTLVHDGKIWITNKEEQMFPDAELEKTPRTAMGYTQDNRLIILVIQGRSPGISDGASLVQEARIMKALACYEALNLDGGGSSCMLINGRETIAPSDPGGQRPLPAVFMIKEEPAKK
jgi:Phosphodiester glycosidase